MMKSEEIDLLQRMTREAGEAGAGYLHDALIALAVPFEAAVRSDFPGKLAAHNLLDNVRDLDARIEAAVEAIRVKEGRIAVLRAQADDIEKRTVHAREKMREMRDEAYRIAGRVS